jgi:hypothetical protein
MSEDAGDERQMNGVFRFGLGLPETQQSNRRTEMAVLNIPKALRAAALVFTLAGSSLVAAPVMAPTPVQAQSLSFSFGGEGFRFRFGDRFGSRFDRRFCMSDRAVRRDLRDRGYREIRFRDRRGRILVLTAERRGNDFLIIYDACRGRILDRRRR